MDLRFKLSAAYALRADTFEISAEAFQLDTIWPFKAGDTAFSTLWFVALAHQARD